MNIKKYAFWSLLFFLSTIYGMEPLPKSPKKDQQFLKNENPENRIGKKAKKIDIHIKMPSKPLSNSVGPQESVLAGSTRTSQGKEKKIPKDAKELQNLISARSVKALPKERKKVRISSVPALNPEGFQRAKERRFSEDSQKTYTHDDVIELLSKLQHQTDSPASHRLYEIGKKKNVPLHELPDYASLFDDIHVSPRLLAECVYELVGEKDKKPKDFEIKEYEKVSKESPEKYEELVFILFKALLERASFPENSNVMPTDLVDFHVGGYEHRIKNQDETVNQGKWALASTVVGWLLTGVGWVIQSQFTNCSDLVVNGTQTS